jgi:hypothetical protein
MDGNLLRLSETRQIAIHRRSGAAWVADFRSGRGELFTVGEWFALNGRGSALRRAVCDAGEPLPPEMIEGIERLHGAEGLAPLAALGERLRDSLARFSRAISCRVLAVALSPRS